MGMNSVTNIGRNGIQDWIIQRVTAYVLALYTLFLLGFFVTTDVDYQAWSSLYNQGWFKIFSLLRSEEHTSELQSRPHIVCRLLLEKKKFTRLSRITSLISALVMPHYSPLPPHKFNWGGRWLFLIKTRTGRGPWAYRVNFTALLSLS